MPTLSGQARDNETCEESVNHKWSGIKSSLNENNNEMITSIFQAESN